jgi:hypothetical protein
MVDGYYAWLEHRARLNTLVAVRAFVDRQMPDEAMTVRDHVTTSLRERTKLRFGFRKERQLRIRLANVRSESRTARNRPKTHNFPQ